MDPEPEPQNETESAAPEPAPDGPRSLDRRHITVERIGWLIFAAIVLVPGVVVVSLALVLDWWAVWVVGVVALSVLLVVTLILWAAWRWPVLDYRATSYRVGPGGIEIRRGVLWRKVINVPRSRVQHTDVAQGPLSRRFGLASLSVHTAGTQNASVTLHGLARPDALAARDVLAPTDDDDGV